MIDHETMLGIIAMEGVAAAAAADPWRLQTPFSKLSETAQNIICGALLGDFETTGPPTMTDEVKAEIAGWIGEPEPRAELWKCDCGWSGKARRLLTISGIQDRCPWCKGYPTSPAMKAAIEATQPNDQCPADGVKAEHGPHQPGYPPDPPISEGERCDKADRQQD